MKKFLFLICFSVLFIGVNAQTQYNSSSYHQFNTSSYGYLRLGTGPIPEYYFETDHSYFRFNKPIYSTNGFLSYNSNLNLEAASGYFVNIKPRNSDYGLIVREYNSDDWGNIEVTSSGLGLGYNTSGSHLMINPNGNIGIGTATPGSKLQVNAEGDPSLIEGQSSGSNQHGFQIWGTDQAMYMGVSTSKRVSYIQSVDVWTSPSTLALNARGGSVAIGTTDAKGYHLAVAGGIIAEKVVVKLRSNWPDFVFDETYKVKSLVEVEAYIKENNHLEGIPSASEVAEQGIDIAEMNALLLKKVEELTLHLIEQNKAIQDLQAKVSSSQNK